MSPHFAYAVCRHFDPALSLAAARRAGRPRRKGLSATVKNLPQITRILAALLATDLVPPISPQPRPRGAHTDKKRTLKTAVEIRILLRGPGVFARQKDSLVGQTRPFFGVFKLCLWGFGDCRRRPFKLKRNESDCRATSPLRRARGFHAPKGQPRGSGAGQAWSR